MTARRVPLGDTGLGVLPWAWPWASPDAAAGGDDSKGPAQEATFAVGTRFETLVDRSRLTNATADSEARPQHVRDARDLPGRPPPGFPNCRRLQRLADLHGAAHGKPHRRIIGQSSVDAAEKQDAVAGVDQQNLGADPADGDHRTRLADGCARGIS